MCSRYSLYDAEAALRKFFGELAPTSAVQNLLHSSGRSIMPMQKAPIVRVSEEDGRLELALVQWGLLPSWSSSAEPRSRKTNASAGTVARDPAFSDPFCNRRCLVLADGFFEWYRVRDQQICFRTTLADGAPFAFAGIWDRWIPNYGPREPVESFAVIFAAGFYQTRADAAGNPIIIDEKDYLVWLRGELMDAARLINRAGTQPMKKYPVGAGFDHKCQQAQMAGPVSLRSARVANRIS